MGNLSRQTTRLLIPRLAFFLPQQRRITVERWLRGREEYHKIQQADFILMSWGKSGRTWLRVMISRFYQQRYGLNGGTMLGFDNYHRKNPAIPRIFFTHGNYLRNFTGDWNTRTDFYPKKVLLLVRDPRDVAVSQYFQWKYRMKPLKKKLNHYPSLGADVPIFDFVMDENVGLPMIIAFFNIWAKEIGKTKGNLTIRYEDMRSNPGTVLAQVFDFLETPGSVAQIRDAVEYAAYENMKKLENKKAYRLSGSRLVPGNRKNPNSYKVRRAKVGGYRDYFADSQIIQIEELVKTSLLPDFGYGGERTTARAGDS